MSDFLLKYVCGLAPAERAQFKAFAAQACKTNTAPDGQQICGEFEYFRTLASALNNKTAAPAVEEEEQQKEEDGGEVVEATLASSGSPMLAYEDLIGEEKEDAGESTALSVPVPVPEEFPKVHRGFWVATVREEHRVDMFLDELNVAAPPLSDAAIAKAEARKARCEHLGCVPFLASMECTLVREMRNQLMWDMWEADREDSLVRAWLEKYVGPLFNKTVHCHMDRMAVAKGMLAKTEPWRDMLSIILSCQKLLTTSVPMSKLRNRTTLKALEFLEHHGLLSAFLCIVELWPEMVTAGRHPYVRLDHNEVQAAEVRAIVNDPVLRATLERQMKANVPAGLKEYVITSLRMDWPGIESGMDGLLELWDVGAKELLQIPPPGVQRSSQL